jgi:hypothetical protein
MRARARPRAEPVCRIGNELSRGRLRWPAVLCFFAGVPAAGRLAGSACGTHRRLRAIAFPGTGVTRRRRVALTTRWRTVAVAPAVAQRDDLAGADGDRDGAGRACGRESGRLGAVTAGAVAGGDPGTNTGALGGWAPGAAVRGAGSGCGIGGGVGSGVGATTGPGAGAVGAG